MPNAPKTPLRTFRLDADLWERFGWATDDRSAVVRDFIRWYVGEPGAKLPKRPQPASRTTAADQGGAGPDSGA